MSYADDMEYNISCSYDFCKSLDDVTEDDKIWIDRYGKNHIIANMEYTYIKKCKNYCIINNKGNYPKLFDVVLNEYELDMFDEEIVCGS